MKVTFIEHSAFLIESAVCTLLFDYYQGALPAVDPKKPLYVFASHFHQDHFSKKIFRLFEDHPDVTYVLSSDIKQHYSIPKDRKTVLIGPDETWQNGIFVETLRSNDEGVAFIVRFPDDPGIPPKEFRTIYHAGDLNDWHWDEEEDSMELVSAYYREMEKIRGRYFDAAFIPLDPRLEAHAPDGILGFAKYADAGSIYPMHMWGKFSVITDFLRRPESRCSAEKTAPVSFYEGERKR